MSFSKNAPLLIRADMRALEALKLRQEGKTYDVIAAKLGYLTPSAAWKAVARGRRALQAQIVAEAETLRKAELAEINLLQRKYEAAYELSGGRKIKELHQVGLDTLSRSYDRTEEWDEVGNPAYLAGILSCIERRCKLLGLDAPTKIAPTTPDGTEEYGHFREELQRRLAGLVAVAGPAGLPGTTE